jgi:hypothetical protein
VITQPTPHRRLPLCPQDGARLVNEELPGDKSDVSSPAFLLDGIPSNCGERAIFDSLRDPTDRELAVAPFGVSNHVVSGIPTVFTQLGVFAGVR